jgi:hypothetical protein
MAVSARNARLCSHLAILFHFQLPQLKNFSPIHILATTEIGILRLRQVSFRMLHNNVRNTLASHSLKNTHYAFQRRFLQFYVLRSFHASKNSLGPQIARNLNCDSGIYKP